MSCGKPHETPCTEVLDRVYSYLDGELEATDGKAKIRQHLDECGPCLREYGLEEVGQAAGAQALRPRRGARGPAGQGADPDPGGPGGAADHPDPGRVAVLARGSDPGPMA